MVILLGSCAFAQIVGYAIGRRAYNNGTPEDIRTPSVPLFL